MKISKKNWIIIVVISILVIGFAFWWYELRPYLAAKYCGNKISDKLNNELADEIEGSLDAQRWYDVLYENCLHNEGL